MRNDLFMEIVKSIILAEEISNNISIKHQLEVKKPEYTTTVGWLKNIVTPFKVIDINGSGELKSIVIKNNDKDFTVKIIVDGTVLYYNSWEELRTISEYTDDIDAFEDNGTYIARFSDIKFSKKIVVNIYSYSSNTVNEVYYKVVKTV